MSIWSGWSAKTLGASDPSRRGQPHRMPPAQRFGPARPAAALTGPGYVASWPGRIESVTNASCCRPGFTLDARAGMEDHYATKVIRETAGR